MLQHEVGKHFEILNRKFSNTTTNHQKKAIWARITDKINALGIAIRTASEVRDKWRNTTSKAKSAFTIHRTELQKTGGGPAPKAPSSQLESEIALYQDSAHVLGDRIPPFFVKKNSPVFSFFLVFLWLTCAISSEKSHYFISSEKSHYFLQLTIQPLPRSILIY